MQDSKTWKDECVPAYRKAHPHTNCNSVRCLIRSDVKGDQHMLRSLKSLSTRNRAGAWCCCGNKDKSPLTRARLSCQEEALADGCDNLDWTSQQLPTPTGHKCLPFSQILPQALYNFWKAYVQPLFFWLSGMSLVLISAWGTMLAGHTSEEQTRKHSKELTLPVWV